MGESRLYGSDARPCEIFLSHARKISTRCTAPVRRTAQVGSVTFFLFCSLISFASALESPQPIGFWCAPNTTSIVDGQYYTPQEDPCTYYSPSLTGFRVGDLYRGIVGSSTKLTGSGLGTFPTGSVSNIPNAMRTFWNVQQGEDIFAAVFIERPFQVSSNDT